MACFPKNPWYNYKEKMDTKDLTVMGHAGMALWIDKKWDWQTGPSVGYPCAVFCRAF